MDDCLASDCPVCGKLATPDSGGMASSAPCSGGCDHVFHTTCIQAFIKPYMRSKAARFVPHSIPCPMSFGIAAQPLGKPASCKGKLITIKALFVRDEAKRNKRVNALLEAARQRAEERQKRKGQRTQELQRYGKAAAPKPAKPAIKVAAPPARPPARAPLFAPARPAAPAGAWPVKSAWQQAKQVAPPVAVEALGAESDSEEELEDGWERVRGKGHGKAKGPRAPAAQLGSSAAAGGTVRVVAAPSKAPIMAVAPQQLKGSRFIPGLPEDEDQLPSHVSSWRRAPLPAAAKARPQNPPQAPATAAPVPAAPAVAAPAPPKAAEVPPMSSDDDTDFWDHYDLGALLAPAVENSSEGASSLVPATAAAPAAAPSAASAMAAEWRSCGTGSRKSRWGSAAEDDAPDASAGAWCAGAAAEGGGQQVAAAVERAAPSSGGAFAVAPPPPCPDIFDQEQLNAIAQLAAQMNAFVQMASARGQPLPAAAAGALKKSAAFAPRPPAFDGDDLEDGDDGTLDELMLLCGV